MRSAMQGGNAFGVGKCEQDGVLAIVMAIHTFGEYLDFHPHLHALVADGLFDREGKFHVMRAGELTGDLTQEQRGTTDAHLAGNHAALEQLFRARVIAFLVEAGLLPLDRARMLRGWECRGRASGHSLLQEDHSESARQACRRSARLDRNAVDIRAEYELYIGRVAQRCEECDESKKYGSGRAVELQRNTVDHESRKSSAGKDKLG